MEIWKDIKGYEGFYQVSNKGNVKRLKGYARLTEKQLKPFLCGQGVQYFKVRLYKKGKGKDKSISRLVAENFLNNPNGYLEVRHLDGNPKNNLLENIAWGTHKMNMHDSIKHGTFSFVDNSGSKNGMSKLKEDDILNIRKLFRAGSMSRNELCLKYGIKYGQICSIVNNKAWKHI